MSVCLCVEEAFSVHLLKFTPNLNSLSSLHHCGGLKKGTGLSWYSVLAELEAQLPGRARRNVTKCTQNHSQNFNWTALLIERAKQRERDRDGGSSLKKQSDYVPGSLLDLRILCLWMKPVTAVDDETPGRFNLLTSLTEAISRLENGHKHTHNIHYINNQT